MKKIAFLILIIFLTSCSAGIKKACFDDNCIDVEVRDTPETRETGLMYREQLDKSEGMLFIHETPDMYTYWMKNMRIPIDIIFLDEDQKIVTAYVGVKPCVADPCAIYPTQKPAKYVVETVSGFTLDNNLYVGQKVEFK